MLHDLKHAVRMLFRSKGWTVVVLLSLAIGIGATTALFTAVNGLLLQTVPVREPGELVNLKWAGDNNMVRSSSDFGFSSLSEGRRVRTTFSHDTYLKLQAANQTLSAMFAGTQLDQVNVAFNGSSDVASAFGVSANYFSALGVSPVIGRAFDTNDERADAELVAMLSHAFWQRRFGGDASVIGKVVRMNNTPVTVIGVLPASYTGIQRLGATLGDVMLLFVHEARVQASSKRLHEPTHWYLQIGGRLKPGITAAAAKDNLAGPFEQAIRAGADSYYRGLSPEAARLNNNQRRGDAAPELLVLPGQRGIYDLDTTSQRSASVLSVVVVLLLLIVCANVANLLLSRASARHKEVSVRLSMGASRSRLIRQLLTESLLLSLTGGALGIVVGYYAKKLLPFGQTTTVDGQVLAFVAGISMLTGVLFGLVPALRATRVDLAGALKDHSRGVVASRTLLSKGLLITQVAVSVVLLIGAGLFVRTLQNLRSVDVGFETSNLLIFRVNPALNQYPQERVTQLYQRIEESIERLPGVRSVAYTRQALLAGGRSITNIYRQGAEKPVDIHYMAVSPGFFDTMGIPIVAGRDFTERETVQADTAALINETAAKQFFPNENPIGQRIGMDLEKSGGTEIIGVIADTKYATVREEIVPTMYVPIHEARGLTVLVRTAGEPALMTETIRQTLQGVDPDVPMTGITTQSDQVDARLAQERLFALAYSLFGVLALLLACIGLFGLMSYSVSRRTNEIGIRMALGAQRAGVVGMVLRESMLMVAIGIAIGFAGALAGGRFIESVLFGLSTTDTVTIAGAIGATILVSFAAGYLPARRASRVDPMVALRYE